MSTDSWVGRTVGDFQLGDRIGSDPSGVSYRATQLSRARTVALKLIGSSLAARASFRERFGREMVLLKSVHHPHLVTTYDAGDHEGMLYVATRYLQATDLEVLIGDTDRISYLSAVEVISQVADGLEYAHTQGLVHRGLTPRSILVLATPEGDHAYLADFGITEGTVAFGGVLEAPDDGSRPLFDYVSPEQIRGEQVDARTDVYGLACVLFEAVTGAPPFERYYGSHKLEAHLSVPPPSATDANSELPDSLDELFATALAKDPGARFSSVLEMAHALPTKQRVLSRWRTMLEAGTMAPEAQAPATVGAFEAVGPAAATSLAGSGGPDPSADELTAAADFTGPPGGEKNDAEANEYDGDGTGGPEEAADAVDVTPSSDEPRWEKSGWGPRAVAFGLIGLAAVAAGVLAVSGTLSDDSEPTAGSERVDAVEPPAVNEDVAATPGSEDSPGAGKDEGKPGAGKDEGKPGEGAGADQRDKKPQTAQSASEVGPWPAGTTGYTAVAFASTTDQAGAEAAAREASGLGLRSGVLHSSDFGSLQPGSWVAFAGIYGSSAEAESAVDQLRQAGVATAPYVRFIGGG